ncbi:hypothetical protein LCGC14_1431650 [marine sediment metagenome]|uniref:Uncharacterized protein n=1 Tax=marine sediment metagenome TaxID=412755 RepID=A0A0F9JNT0_9ZZZZ
MKNAKKLGLPISSKTGEPLKPFIKPKDTLLRGIIVITFGFFWWLIAYIGGNNFTSLLIFSFITGCALISRAKLGNKHVRAHQIIILISDIFIFIMGFVFSIYFWSAPDLLFMIMGIIIITVSTLASIIHCLYWLVKLDKYKVKNELFRRDRNSIIYE